MGVVTELGRDRLQEPLDSSLAYCYYWPFKCVPEIAEGSRKLCNLRLSGRNIM